MIKIRQNTYFKHAPTYPDRTFIIRTYRKSINTNTKGGNERLNAVRIERWFQRNKDITGVGTLGAADREAAAGEAVETLDADITGDCSAAVKHDPAMELRK